MAEKGKVRALTIELTPEQREQIRRVLGKEVGELELTAEVLEERVPCLRDLRLGDGGELVVHGFSHSKWPDPGGDRRTYRLIPRYFRQNPAISLTSGADLGVSP